MTTVLHWTGYEARALRSALRLSVRGFAEHLGISQRTVSSWESRLAGIRPQPAMQDLLDAGLAQAPVTHEHGSRNWPDATRSA